MAFDVGSREQFEQLDAWAHESAKFGARDMCVVVCANKVCELFQYRNCMTCNSSFVVVIRKESITCNSSFVVVIRKESIKISGQVLGFWHQNPKSLICIVGDDSHNHHYMQKDLQSML